MGLSKKMMKQVMILILITVLLFTGLNHLNYVLAFLNKILYLLIPFIMGLCIAFIFNVILKAVENKWLKFLNKYTWWAKIKRPCSVILTLSLVFGLVVFIFILIIPELKNTFELLIQNIPLYQDQILKWAGQLDLSSDAIDILENGWKQFSASLLNFVQNNSSNFLNITIGFTTSIFTAVFNFIIGVVFAIYILLEKEKYGKQVKQILYAFLPKTKAEKTIELGLLSHSIFSKFVSGQLIEAVIIGILCFVGMLLLGLPYALTISVLVGFTALIPVFGAFIGTFVGAFLILIVDPIQAIIFVLFIIILQQFEGNLIYPKVVGTSVGLPSIWVMLAVTVGGSMMGILGMLISVPLCSIVYTLFRTYVKEKIQQKHLERKLS